MENIKGINRLVKLSIVLGDKVINNYKLFHLKQGTSFHHEFELVCDYDSIGKNENFSLEQSSKFIGEKITVEFSYKNIADNTKTTFQGLVTEVKFNQEGNSRGNVVICGTAPTVLLDMGKNVQSFGGDTSVSIAEIAKNLIDQGVSGRFDTEINVENKVELLYSGQYEETNYNYLNRLANAFGEQFFYDGSTLTFGKYSKSENPHKLVYGANIADMTVGMSVIHNQPEFYDYNSEQNEVLKSKGANVDHKSKLTEQSYNAGSKVYTNRSLSPSPFKFNRGKDISDTQNNRLGIETTQLFTITGKTIFPFLYPGCEVDINMRSGIDPSSNHFTKAVIIEIEHEVNKLGEYIGEFKAIPADTKYLPLAEFEKPNIHQQIALVIDNADPENQGRVKVRFIWQMHETSAWIRVLSPDAGGTDQITQNRGYVAIPEIGDQVMVGFEDSNPDKPFVLGSLFHGSNGSGGGPENHKKSIQTRSGIKILMDDAEGSVRVEDPSGNFLFFDGNGNIELNAPSNLNINVGSNMNITVGENMSTNVGSNNSLSVTSNNNVMVGKVMSESVGANKTQSVSGDYINNVSGNMIHHVMGDREEFSEKEYKVTGLNGIDVNSEENIVFNAEDEIMSNSGENSNSF